MSELNKSFHDGTSLCNIDFCLRLGNIIGLIKSMKSTIREEGGVLKAL